jgi:hypothetical protein
VITKSGSNEFHGDAFGYFDDKSLQSSAKPVVSTGGTLEGFQRKDFGVDLGGYFWKDRIWFFGAYDRVQNTITTTLPSGPLAGQSTDSDSTRNLASAKLTFHLDSPHSREPIFRILRWTQEPSTTRITR